ncbi:PIN domain-containing protein [Sphingobacterium sp.]|uniref:PIN domain-containing protein n=1 Tax=Sphingobacterium sp. TaxID=341027 RepID=UPI002897BEDF|nr:PIN domain-containing protein [Sphingobacterium sp.]
MIFLQSSPSPKDGDFFILDTNIWLPILGFESDENISDHYKSYFSKIIKSENCRILISPLQISEIFNRWLRFHAYKKYIKDGKNGDFKNYYKSNYRKSQDFTDKYYLIKEDLENYVDSLILVELRHLDLDTVTCFPPDEMDFNDNYLYQLAKQHDVTLITDDGDFTKDDCKIATYNKKLFRSHTDKIKPKTKV